MTCIWPDIYVSQVTELELDLSDAQMQLQNSLTESSAAEQQYMATLEGLRAELNAANSEKKDLKMRVESVELQQQQAEASIADLKEELSTVHGELEGCQGDAGSDAVVEQVQLVLLR